VPGIVSAILKGCPIAGVGRTHARTPVFLLVQDLHVRVVAIPTSGLRELIVDPTRNYQSRRKRERTKNGPAAGGSV
jgi:hypothetical protein